MSGFGCIRTTVGRAVRHGKPLGSLLTAFVLLASLLLTTLPLAPEPVQAATGGYDGQAAYGYAQEYWDKVCSDGYFFEASYPPSDLGAGNPVPTECGLDCAHFVSCCIGSEPHAPGGGLNIPSRTEAYGEPGAKRLADWLIESGYAEEKATVGDLAMGDVIVYERDGGYHAVLYLGGGKIAAHSVSYWQVNWDIYLSTGFTVYARIHINGPPQTERNPVSVTDPLPYFGKGSNTGPADYWYAHTYEGHDYISTYVGGQIDDPTKPDYWAEFRPYLSEAGDYEVYAYYYGCPDTSEHVPFTIHHAGGSEVVTVNQKTASATWKQTYLGTWTFAAGADTRIVVTDATGEPYDGITELTIGSVEFVGAPRDPTIAYSPTSFSFSAIEGGSNPPDQTLSIWNSGEGTLTWYAYEGSSWLTLSPTSGTCTTETDNVIVSVDISGKSAGVYNATITIDAPVATNTPQTVPVTLTIEPLIQTIAYSPTSFSFSAFEGDPNPPDKTLSIWNSGQGTLAWNVSDDVDWLTLSPTSGTSTGETDSVTLSVDISGKSAGIYNATITVTAPGAANTPQTVAVTLTINAISPTWDIDRDGTVDYKDLAILGAAYGCCDGDPGYNPDADINQDGCVDYKDLAILGAHYGEEY